MRAARTLGLIVVAVCCAGAARAWAEPGPFPNGSFEAGTVSPDGWRSSSDRESSVRADWRMGDARHGARSLGGQSRRAAKVWESSPVEVTASRVYIVEGWFHVRRGAAWLHAVLVDEQGNTLAESTSSRVRASKGWTYAAAETPCVDAGAAPSKSFLRVEFWVHGAAVLDDARVTPQSPPLVANSGFELPLDKKNRVPMWDEEKESSILPGVRAAGISLDPQNPFEGNSSVCLTPTGDWGAVSSLNYSVPSWADGIRIETMARCSGGARAQLAALWADDYAQHVIRVDHGPVYGGDAWRMMRTDTLTPPEGASGVRVVLLALKPPQTGSVSPSAHFDAAELVSCVSGAPGAHVMVNQVGYSGRGPKAAMVMTNFFPEDSANAAFSVLDTAGGTVFRGPLICGGRMVGQKDADWGWYFWRADFSRFKKAGTWKVSASIAKTASESFSFVIAPDRLFAETADANVDFFYVQRCGFDVPGWHAACHMDDAKLPDGTHRDLTGGWHSAGDYNKISYEYGDGGVMYALVNAYEAAPSAFEAHKRTGAGLCDALDEAWWGAKYLAKLQIPETGGFYKDIQQGPDRKTWMAFVPPEKQTDGIPETADDPIVQAGGEGNSPLAIGGWARLSVLLVACGIENDYLARAVKAWDHVTSAGGAEGAPLMLISAVDLYSVTREDRYLAFARRSVEALLGTAKDGALPGGYANSGDIPAAALAYFALKMPKDALAPRIRECLARHLETFLAEPDNPLGLSRQQPGKDGYFFEPTSSLGHNWELGSRAWAAMMMYRVLHDRRAREYATNQIDFILGRNTYNLCMFEGKGSFNPPRYHHRYITIPGHERGAVPGAIPNGFVRDVAGNDRPGFDLSRTGRQYPSYRTNEPWLIHNVFYTLAVTALHEAERERR
ncbi:MAG: glycoside hydrolase family 9 protein [Candidatus Hydrogenedentes bacterium]|nr:glycoside hydrolase family 9 protein [Candidatus Hydrogenedentota bacterium]